VPAEIGIGLQSDKSLADYAALARSAEDLGIDVITVFSDLLYQPPIIPLMEMARVTSRVRLGAACWNPYTLHPYEIAGQVAALDAASDGRAYCGLAKGTWLDQLGIEQDRPIGHLRAAADLIAALLSGSTDGLHSDLFPLAPGAALRYPIRRPRVPLLIGSWGEQGAALAGEIADEIKIGGSANPALVPLMRDRIASGAHRIGRDPREVRLVFGAVTVVDHDRERARSLARRDVGMYVEAIAAFDPTVTLPADIDRHIPDDLLDLFAFSGTPEDVAAQAQRLLDAGVDRVEFGTPQGVTTAHGIDLIGREVLPLLRR
jgi:5,10-methylenetetrahydromethanopterin reductase